MNIHNLGITYSIEYVFIMFQITWFFFLLTLFFFFHHIFSMTYYVNISVIGPLSPILVGIKQTNPHAPIVLCSVVELVVTTSKTRLSHYNLARSIPYAHLTTLIVTRYLKFLPGLLTQMELTTFLIKCFWGSLTKEIFSQLKFLSGLFTLVDLTKSYH